MTPDLFDVQEVLGLEGDGCSRHGHVVFVRGGVGEVTEHGERHRLELGTHVERHNVRDSRTESAVVCMSYSQSLVECVLSSNYLTDLQ